MKQYHVCVHGNDVFTASKVVKASSIRNALTLAEEFMEALGGQTIEQLRVTRVVEI